MLTVRDFRQLRELELEASRPGSSHRILISSISSTELRKVTFLLRYTYSWTSFAQQTEGWASIDKALCGLVDRLSTEGYRHTLEAQLRLRGIRYDGKHDFTKFLPEFREKGVVTVIDASYTVDRLIHSSVHSCRDRAGI